MPDRQSVAPSLIDEASALDVAPMFAEISGGHASDVSPASLIRYLVEHLGHTVERAKGIIYALSDMGKLVITERYMIRQEPNAVLHSNDT